MKGDPETKPPFANFWTCPLLIASAKPSLNLDAVFCPSLNPSGDKIEGNESAFKKPGCVDSGVHLEARIPDSTLPDLFSTLSFLDDLSKPEFDVHEDATIPESVLTSLSGSSSPLSIYPLSALGVQPEAKTPD